VAQISIDGVTKRYGATEVLKRLDLSVAEGEFMVLLGPSGCGKTTLLRMIAGLETPTTGRIMIGGTDVTLTPPAKRDVGMVFQSYALYPHMTVRENIALGLKLRGVTQAEIASRIERVANLVQIAPYLERKPKALSGGQRQRIAIARALLRDPRILLLDEATSALDAESEALVQQALTRLRSGRTTLVVAHRLATVRDADHIAVLNNGQIIESGTYASLLNENGTFARLVRAQALT
jgi:ABC-type sugar transport system ATPase subunit